MITVLMAVRNGEKYLDAQLESLFQQTVPCHIVICDDASTDGTRTLLERYQKKITMIHSPKQLGACQTFSKLLQVANTPYICFSDADDVWLPEKLERTLDAMKQMETTSPTLIHTDLTVVDASLNPLSDSFWQYSHLTPHSKLSRQLVQNTITGNTVMINQPLQALCGKIPKHAIMHDWWLGLLAASFGHIEWVDSPTVLYRQHSNNDTGAKPYSLFADFSLSGRREINRRVYSQAATFLKSYPHTPENRLLIKAYLDFANTYPLLKAIPMIRHGFYKQGLLRTIKSVFS